MTNVVRVLSLSLKMTTHRFLTADSRKLAEIGDSSINLIVTSPPYPMIAMWDELFSSFDPQISEDLIYGAGMAAFERMNDVLFDVWRECDRVLYDGGFVCINIGDAVRTINDRFCMYPNHEKVISFFLSLGYTMLPDIHWCKPSNAPNKFMGSGMYPAGAYVTYEHEYILIFRKENKRVFSEAEKVRRKHSAYFWEERNVWFSDLWEIKGTSQKASIKGSRSRNASFSFDVPYRLVNMYSIEGDTVLDPFGGLGTTSLACMGANRNSISVDIDEGFTEQAYKRVSESVDVLNDIIEQRLCKHLQYIASLPQEKQKDLYFNRYHNCFVRTRQETELYLRTIQSIQNKGNILTCLYNDEFER